MTREVKIRPILFKRVKALMDGRKTQTRRVISKRVKHPDAVFTSTPSDFANVEMIKANWPCPYGGVGDQLWVRESCFLYGYWKKNGNTKSGRQKWRFVCEKGAGVKYLENPPFLIERTKLGVGWTKRSAIHMPRWASRILLELIELRVERLQKISNQDVFAEGCENWNVYDATLPDAYGQFKKLWEAINGPGSWDMNPWVWVLEFKRLLTPQHTEGEPIGQIPRY